MTEVADLLRGDHEFWLSELPPYQRATIDSMLNSGMDFQDIAIAWMSGAVAETTAPFGAGLGVKLFFDSFLDELHDFLCTGRNYEQERNRILSDFKPGQTGLAAAISTEIAPHLAAAPAFVTPAVTVTFCAITKIGLSAWCHMQSVRRSAGSEPPQSPGDSSQQG